MQGKCNLLKPVDSKTGTFFMFSQYAQDLTKQYAQSDTYRCVPSKSVALCLDLNELNLNNPPVDPSKEWTNNELAAIELGEIFQNYYENACAFLRTQMNTVGEEWNPTYSNILLWQTLIKYGLIHVKNEEYDNISRNYCPEVLHVNNINIYSYNDGEDGIGFNEIYCYIPIDAKRTHYYGSTQEYASGKSFLYDGEDLCGYAGESFTGVSFKARYEIDNSGSTSKKYYNISSFVPDVLGDQTTSYYSEASDDRFDINAVVVFYDIVKRGSEEDTVLYHNIPLGIYFLGAPEQRISLILERPITTIVMSNTFTKFVQSSDINNQGTSYGLRICSRYLCVPNQTTFSSVETSSVGGTQDLTSVMSKFAESSSLMNEVIETNNGVLDTLKNHLNSFKNYRTNIPYIRKLNGTDYWFVNGKNTGVPTSVVIEKESGGTGSITINIKPINNNTELSDIYTNKDLTEWDDIKYATASNLQSMYHKINQSISGSVGRLMTQINSLKTQLDELQAEVSDNQSAQVFEDLNTTDEFGSFSTSQNQIY